VVILINDLKIIFAGTSEFATYHFNTLLSYKYKIVGVLTKPDYFDKNKSYTNINTVKQLAQKYNIPVFQPKSLNKIDIQKKIISLNVDIIIVVSYGLIFPKEILNIPRLGCINIHGSLLPRWRGAAPIQRALCSGDTKTGITIIKMDSGIDTGTIIYQKNCNISSNDTTGTLLKKLEIIGAFALKNILKRFKIGNIIGIPQNEKYATYANKISKKEAKLDWFLSAVQLERYIRAYNPWPVSYFKINEMIIKVWEATVINKQYYFKNTPGLILSTEKDGISIATGNEILKITLLQPEGKRIMYAKEFLNAKRTYFIPGIILI